MRRLFFTSSLNHDLTALFLRLIIGGFFVHYGYSKIQMWDNLKTMFPDYTGLGSAGSLGLLIFAEFGCGLLVLWVALQDSPLFRFVSQWRWLIL